MEHYNYFALSGRLAECLLQRGLTADSAARLSKVSPRTRKAILASYPARAIPQHVAYRLQLTFGESVVSARHDPYFDDEF